MNRRRFLQILGTGLAKGSIPPMSLPVQKLVGSGVSAIERIYKISDIRNVVRDHITDHFGLSCASDDFQTLTRGTSLFRTSLDMVNILDELEWMGLTSTKSPDINLAWKENDDESSYNNRLKSQYQYILSVFVDAIENLNEEEFDIHRYYLAAMGGVQDNECLCHNSNTEHLSTKYDELKGIIQVYDGCNDGGSIPEGAELLYEIPLSDIDSKELRETILKRLKDILNDINKSYGVFKKTLAIKTKLKNVYGLEPQRGMDDLTVSTVIKAYQKQIINNYIRLCIEEQKVILPLDFIKGLQERLEVVGYEEKLEPLFFVKTSSTNGGVSITKQEEELFNGPIALEAIFTDQLISQIYQNSNIIENEWNKTRELDKCV